MVTPRLFPPEIEHRKSQSHEGDGSDEFPLIKMGGFSGSSRQMIGSVVSYNYIC